MGGSTSSLLLGHIAWFSCKQYSFLIASSLNRRTEYSTQSTWFGVSCSLVSYVSSSSPACRFDRKSPSSGDGVLFASRAREEYGNLVKGTKDDWSVQRKPWKN